jgi:hypothetical protein
MAVSCRPFPPVSVEGERAVKCPRGNRKFGSANFESRPNQSETHGLVNAGLKERI